MRRSTSLRATDGSIFSKPRKYCSYSARSRSSRVSSSSSAMSSSSKFTRLPRERRHHDVVETDRDFPVVEAEVFVTGAVKRLRVVERENLRVVDAEAHGVTVAPLDLETVRTPLRDRRDARVVGAWHQPDFSPIRAVFVQTCEHVQAVLPAAEDDEVAR